MSEAAPEVPLVDLAAQRRRLEGRIEAAVAAVLDHGQFVLGPEVGRFEEQLAGVGGVAHAVGCSSGTDALLLALLAWGAGTGDAVFVPAFTFAATAEVVALVGATPVFVDVRADTFTIDPASLAGAIEWAPAAGLRPVGIITVDLFGQPADYGEIEDVAAAAGLWVLADAAQSLGATFAGRPVGSLATATATSFFPGKPLGCYGDGGAVLTDDAQLAERLRSLRAHGQGASRFDHVRIGLNARLDTVQAAVLLAKLDIFDDERVDRQAVADRYGERLAGAVTVPSVRSGTTSAWACYTVLTPHRDRLTGALRRTRIASAVYYPKPLHHQPAFRGFPTAPQGLPVSERLAGEVLSLPVHPYLDVPTQHRVVDAVWAAAGSAP
ncbi:MAG: DegT/DnrJ/EryC1/StrS family aminotransferase [Actinobacteria bacterium]|nr:DegT/DnrJ/EryC1/StrS family aminotransferase [Actinomycetota bacterium]